MALRDGTPRERDALERHAAKPRMSSVFIVVLLFVALIAAVLSAFYREERAVTNAPANTPPSTQQPDTTPPINQAPSE